VDNPIPVTGAMAQRIEVWPVERPVPCARNARMHSDAPVAHIAASIAKFGVNAPLLVDFKRIRFPGLEELIAGAEG
jgi:ParB-like chromosome segregation protein Spo0J